MKKRIIALLALLLSLSLILSGCGGSGKEAQDEKGGENIEKEEGPVFDPALAGNWLYNFYDITLSFDETGSVGYKTPNAEGSYSYFFDGSVLELKDGEKPVGSAQMNDKGNLVFEGLNGCFYPEGSSAYEPLPNSESMLLGTNSELGKKRSLLKDSAVFFNKDKDYYQRVDADWTVVVGEPEIKDGRKIITAAAACFIPMANVPVIDFPFHYNCGLYLFDKYTGLALSTDDFFEVEEDGFIHVFDSEQGRVTLTIHRGRENSGPVGDCYDVMGFTYTFSFPEWYDGLILAATPKPDNMEDLLKSLDGPDEPLGLMVLPYSDGLVESGLRYNIK